MSLHDYFASERFIHDNLLQEAEVGLGAVKESVELSGSVNPFVLSWLSEPVKDADGNTIEHIMLFDMPSDKKWWGKEFIRIVKKTDPYALLLVEQEKDEVVALFESRHGSKSWRYQIVPSKSKSGKTVKKPAVRTDHECIGLLWRPVRRQEP